MKSARIAFVLLCLLVGACNPEQITHSDKSKPPEGKGRASQVSRASTSPNAQSPTPIDPIKPDWYGDRVRRWESLLRQAGQHKRGLVLESRIISDSLGSASNLLVGVRNVGDNPVDIEEGACEDAPILLIRDESGKAVPMTEKGETYHSPFIRRAGSNWPVKMTPGMVRDSFSIPLREHFALTNPGRYTVLSIKSLLGVEEELIAPAVTFEIRQSGPSPDMKGHKDEQSHKKGTNDEVADGWAALEARVGLFQHGFVLEADLSPVRPEAMNLIVSLVQVGDDDRDFSPFFASVPSEYHILVRDPAGRLVPVNEIARKGFTTDEKNRPEGCSVGLGMGNGALIPLAKWFDMKMPGEYTVLVSFPFRGDKEAVCVARPFNVKITKPGRDQLQKQH